MTALIVDKPSVIYGTTILDGRRSKFHLPLHDKQQDSEDLVIITFDL